MCTLANVLPGHPKRQGLSLVHDGEANAAQVIASVIERDHTRDCVEVSGSGQSVPDAGALQSPLLDSPPQGQANDLSG